MAMAMASGEERFGWVSGWFTCACLDEEGEPGRKLGRAVCVRVAEPGALSEEGARKGREGS